MHQIFISPNPTAVCLLFVRLEDGRLTVALGRRGLKNEFAHGKWALPGGFIEAETGREAAVQEFKEELGVDISHVNMRHVAERYDRVTHCSNHFYAGLWPDKIPPQLQVTEESSEVMLCPIDEIPNDLAFPYQADIIREAARLFR